MKKQFYKVMGVCSAMSMVVGIIIGTGIFLTAGQIANYIHSPTWILVAWVVGGLVATTGAITMAQLSSLLPQVGGLYVYIREAFGELMAFWYGCVLFLVLQCGSIAAVGMGFAYYFGNLFPSTSSSLLDLYFFSISGGQITAMIAIALLTYVNYIGARFSTIMQLLLTLLSVITIIAFIATAFASSKSQTLVFSLSNPPSFSNFSLAMIPILWTFSGWYNLNFAAEEVENTSRTITISLLAGMILVTILYLLVNVVYLTTLSVTQIQKEKQIAYTVMNIIIPNSGSFISMAIVISALGTLNGLIFASPRAYFAMAKDKLFPILPAKLHQKYGTPHSFILVQALWSICLVVLGQGSYEALFSYVMFTGLLFTSLAGVAVIIVRKNNPQKLAISWAYPWVPIFFTLSSVGLAINTCYYNFFESLIGLAIVIFTFPLYFIMKARK
ncbi:APC family permease [Candidatus Uabimicrobium sp. HlEnr_7]|uniref:APC family permease n=1 Tax=Candidatus Uabimicrobium helgolandensis TaxID=3095367 RepID=UPI0035582913